MEKINKYIDHTLLRADATKQEIINLCEEAKKFKFASVCVNSVYVSLASELLKGSIVKVCTVIGFPLGASISTVKNREAGVAKFYGAKEFDMVINISDLKDKNYKKVSNDIKEVRDVLTEQDDILKVIIETCYLSKQEIISACTIAATNGANFVKTSTGFGTGGAKVEDVELMRKTVGNSIGVKASGGIKTREQAIAMIGAGANRIGTSAGVEICS